MDSLTALRKLENTGLSMTEAFRFLVYIREEREYPTSRQKAKKLLRVREIFQEAGVEPEDVEFDPDGAI